MKIMITRKFEILPWMTAQLKLSGNELVLFAILWKESKQGTQQVKGNYAFLSMMMGCTVPTMYSAAKKLVDRNLVTMPSKGMYAIAESLNVS